uniref:Uncharacterized protein n=1 Tax=Glossina austeni TaxID=7395 RepID=A0A1A9V8V1_GLOAU
MDAIVDMKRSENGFDKGSEIGGRKTLTLKANYDEKICSPKVGKISAAIEIKNEQHEGVAIAFPANGNIEKLLGKNHKNNNNEMSIHCYENNQEFESSSVNGQILPQIMELKFITKTFLPSAITRGVAH